MTSVRMTALVCAAGVGARMGLDRPKQYLRLGRPTMLEHTVRAIAAVERVDDVVVVVSAEDAYIDEVAANFPAKARVLKVGGTTRAETVQNGIAALGVALGRLGARARCGEALPLRHGSRPPDRRGALGRHGRGRHPGASDDGHGEARGCASPNS